MKTLVIAEHDNTSLKTATLNAVAAAGRWAAMWTYSSPELVAARSQRQPRRFLVFKSHLCG